MRPASRYSGTLRGRSGRSEWIVDLQAVRANAALLQSVTGKPLLAIVKADAYGTGAVPVAQTLREQVAAFGVATLPEALELIRHGVHRVWIMSPIPRNTYAEAIRAGIWLTVQNRCQLDCVRKIAGQLHTVAYVQIAVDTGMHRIGAPYADVQQLIEYATGSSHVQVVGVFSHLACAEQDAPLNELQVQRLRASCDRENVPVHVANSAACLRAHGYDMQYVRAGMALYGISPDGNDYGLRRACRWICRIVSLQRVPQGDGIGYGQTFVTARPSVIATLAVGYADGYPRSLSNRGTVRIHGQDCPIVGKICMDMMSVDVTDCPRVQVGDWAELYGDAPPVRIERLAELAGSCAYESMCRIAPRVPRRYRD